MPIKKPTKHMPHKISVEEFLAKEKKPVAQAKEVEQENLYKDANPKDLIGASKLPLDLVPQSTMAYLAIGHYEGKLKYGAFNWRAAPVRFSIYWAACQRHMAALMNGESFDTETLVPHMASALACISIICDASTNGTLVDDRPPVVAGYNEMRGDIESIMRHLEHLHKDKTPTHWTEKTMQQR